MTIGDRDDEVEAPIMYEPPGLMAMWHRGFAWMIFMLALLMRAAFLKQLEGSALWEHLPGDAGYYRDWALHIAAGDPVATGAFERSPLCAYMLAGVFRYLGPGLMAPRLLQAVIGAATCVLIYWIGRKVLSPAAGLAAGLIAAIHGPSLLRDAAITPDALALFFCAAALHQIFTANGSQRGLLTTSGLCLGLSALARGPMLLLAPVVALWLMLDPWLGGGRWTERAKESAGRLAAFAIGLALVLAPVAARNYHASSDFVLMATGAGGATAGLDDAGYREILPMLRVSDPAWRLLAPLAAAGLALTLQRWREMLCLYLIIGSCAIRALFGIPGAPGISLALIVEVFAGAGIVEIARCLASRKWLHVALAAAAILAMLAWPGLLGGVATGM
jgi:4-amino-4-deoxy-L-arabinose transferase-like glycosyltransferase